MEGRVALVTGSSKGIGRAIARSLARGGAKVVVTARGPEALEQAAQEANGYGGNVLPIAADATDPNAVRAVVESAVRHFGGLDILVNNVGGANRIAEFAELTKEDWIHTFELNVMTVVYFVQAALPWLRKSAGGRIINMASITGVEPSQLAPHYAASKAAIINLSKHLANLCAPNGILVNVVCPGQVSSEARQGLADYVARTHNIPLADARVRIDAEGASRIPLGRLGVCEDVAELVSFLASEKAGWITGECFHVDGGKHRSAF
ncbi:MAG: glucose 1-dehydrogenase [Candidatus Omnitrophica bacterium]|nr:glucose 1-dehydrogenase [Candidatus Omnitrophota bacterium]